DDDEVPLVLRQLDRGAQAYAHLLLPVVTLLARAVQEEDRRMGLLGLVLLRDEDDVFHRRAVVLDRLVEETGLGGSRAEQNARQNRGLHGVLLFRETP